MSVTKQGPVEESEVACDENQGISMAQESEELIDDSSVNNATTNQSRTAEDIVVDQGNVIEKVTIENEGTNVEMVTENSNVQFQGHDQNSNETCSDTGTSLPLNTDTPLDNSTAIPLNVVEEGTNMGMVTLMKLTCRQMTHKRLMKFMKLRNILVTVL